MDEKPLNTQETNPDQEPPETSARSNAWSWAAAIILGFVLIITLALFFREQDSRRQVDSANVQLNAELSQMHDQISDLSARVNALLATPPAQSPAAADPLPQGAESTPAQHPAIKHSARKHAVARKDDPRWKQMKDQLADNKQQIEATQAQLESNRQEMQNNLNSTRDDLNGSIAKTHDELVELEKKGQRNYYEFNLAKSKGFDHIGPISLSLRKTSVKHGYYDIAVLVEDSRLDKKHINLFEPVLFYPSDSHQPLELVVNRIEKDVVQGYVSAPKYKEAEAAAAPPSDQSPADGKAADLQRRPGDQK